MSRKIDTFSMAQNRFSVLTFIDETFKSKDTNKYEFMLVYPELNCIIHWEQKSNIHINTRETEFKTLDANESISLLDGLAPSTNRTALLDGQTQHVDWWFAIGSTRSYYEGIPGPVISENGRIITESSLWIRFDDLKQISRFPKRICTCRVRTYSKLLYSSLLFVSLFTVESKE